MSGISRWMTGSELRKNLGDVTGLGADVYNGSRHAKNIVNLARVDEPHKRITHHDDLSIRRRERSRKISQWLIGKAKDPGRLIVDFGFRVFLGGGCSRRRDG